MSSCDGDSLLSFWRGRRSSDSVAPLPWRQMVRSCYPQSNTLVQGLSQPRWFWRYYTYLFKHHLSHQQGQKSSPSASVVCCPGGMYEMIWCIEKVGTVIRYHWKFTHNLQRPGSHWYADYVTLNRPDGLVKALLTCFAYSFYPVTAQLESKS